MEGIDLRSLTKDLEKRAPVRGYGRVTRVIGLTIESEGPNAHLGELCNIRGGRGAEPLPAEVVGFRENRVLLMPLGSLSGLAPGAEVIGTGQAMSVPLGKELLGRVIDGLGKPIDGKGSFRGEVIYPVHNQPPDPMTRLRIKEPLSLGIRSIDSLITCGRGQRVGIFSGSGVGKSSLLAMCARYTSADIIVIGLIGERGREVRDFIERDLGPEGLSRAVVVVSTSDQPALIRVKGALVTTAIAEYFRDQGKNVLLIMDSLTRVAMALREVGLAIGEPPATRGYPPSVFAFMPGLLERSGANEVGTITGLYSVLVEGDDLQEPVTDTVRGILDGHIVLSRKLAGEGHYPPVDVLQSVSRLMPEITSQEDFQAAGKLRRLLSAYDNARDLISIGAYKRGSDSNVDKALERMDGIKSFLQQELDEKATYEDAFSGLRKLVEGV